MSTHTQIFQSTQPLNLKSGATLASFELAYETYGTLNAEGTNAIWVCHALTGSAHVAAHQHTTEKGWWEAMVGPGLAIDTNTYFVVWEICSQLLPWGSRPCLRLLRLSCTKRIESKHVILLSVSIAIFFRAKRVACDGCSSAGNFRANGMRCILIWNMILRLLHASK